MFPKAKLILALIVAFILHSMEDGLQFLLFNLSDSPYIVPVICTFGEQTLLMIAICFKSLACFKSLFHKFTNVSNILQAQSRYDMIIFEAI